MALVSLLGYQPDDIYITSGPLYHSGPGGVHGHRARSLARRSWSSGSSIRRTGCAWWRSTRSSSTFSAPRAGPDGVRAAAEIKASYDRSSMRVMIANAAPWSYALKQQYVADFPPSRCGRSTARPSSVSTACCSQRTRCASQAPAASLLPASRSCSSTRTGASSRAPGLTTWGAVRPVQGSSTSTTSSRTATSGESRRLPYRR